MSDYTVVNAVSETLRSLVWSRVEHDNQIASILNEDDQNISLEPPFRLLTDNNEPDHSCLSIYLYRINEDGQMKNRSLERRNGSLLEYPPLALDLFYLITPLTGRIDNDQRLLAKVMQILYDNAIIKGSDLQEVLQDTMEELRVILNPITVEDMTRIWSGFLLPYRLSLSYEVRVIYIDSQRQIDTDLIQRKRLEFTNLSGG